MKVFLSKMALGSVVFVMAMALFSCSVGPDVVENTQQGSSTPTETIDISNLPEISPPISPEQAETDYADAITRMETEGEVAHDDAAPDVYYVMLYLTNVNQYSNLLSYYIVYSVLPFAGLETDPQLIAAANQVGVITGEGYSNVYPVYALLTSAHYNEFLNNKDFIFKPIRKVSYQELKNLNFGSDFLYSYDEDMTNQGITPKNLGFNNLWMTICNTLGLAQSTPLNTTDVSFPVKYVDSDNNSKIIPGINIRCYELGGIGMKSARTDTNGDMSIALKSGCQYKIELELYTPYIYVVRDSVWYDTIVVNSSYDVPGTRSIISKNVPATRSSTVNIISEDEIFAFVHLIFECAIFAIVEEGLPDPGHFELNISADMPDGVAGRGGYYGITIHPNYIANIGTVAHEFGHFMHANGMGRTKWGLGRDGDGKYIGQQGIWAPDGKNLASGTSYAMNEMCFLQEGWAEFFASAFLKSKYPTKFNNGSYENGIQLEFNYGSKEIFYRTFTSNSGVIGTLGNNYLYNYEFPRFNREASILFDLWDDNSSYPNTIYNDEGQKIAYEEYSASQYYTETEFADEWNWQTNYNRAAYIRRENELDQVSLPLSIIFVIMLSPNDDSESPLYWGKSLPERIKTLAPLLTTLSLNQVNLEKLTNLLFLHSQASPGFITDDDAPTVSLISPNNATEQFTNFTVTVSASDTWSGVETVKIYVATTDWGTTQEITANLSGELYTANFTVVEGAYYVWATAVDNAGNTSSTITNQIDAFQGVPLLTITSPVSNGIFLTNDLTDVMVRGIAQVVLPAILTGVKVVVNGVTNDAEGTDNWSYNLTPNRTNHIEVFALADNGKNSIPKSIEIIIPVYVAPTGNDANLGTVSAPKQNIQSAIAYAKSVGISDIRLKSGTYTPGNGLNSSGNGISISENNFVLTGGWNNDFSAQTGYSVLDANANGRVIYASSKQGIEMSRLWITDGSTSEGGGVYFINVSSSILTNCVISNNTTTTIGGGVYLNNSSIAIYNSIVSYNNSSGHGGGISLFQSTGIIKNCTVNHNTVLDSGGGININYSTSTVSGCTINYNEANDGAGMVVSVSPSVSMDNNTIKYNQASGHGGGMFLNNSSPLMGNNFIDSNTATGNGGGIYTWNNASPTISGGSISHNQGYLGAGIQLDGALTAVLDGIIVNSNTGTGHGGGIGVKNGSPTVKNCTVKYNKVEYSGGGINVNDSATTVQGNIILYNEADEGAGMVVSISPSAIVNNNTIKFNYASVVGGGIYFSSSTGATFNNNITDYNTAISYGGGIYIFNTTLSITGGSVSYNTLYGFGKGSGDISTSGVTLTGNTPSLKNW